MELYGSISPEDGILISGQCRVCQDIMTLEGRM